MAFTLELNWSKTAVHYEDVANTRPLLAPLFLPVQVTNS